MYEPTYTQDTLDRLREQYIEIGKLRQMNYLNKQGSPFVVPHEFTHEVIRLLLSNGFELSNDAELYAFRVHRPSGQGTA